ncbi:hypothetical protein [Massilia timonae]|jgi:hypothetical protein|nr:hypothetical protein [Massilia timonae]
MLISRRPWRALHSSCLLALSLTPIAAAVAQVAEVAQSAPASASAAAG